MPMLLRAIALLLTVVFYFGGSSFASQMPTTAQKQFERAQQLAHAPNADSPADIRYLLNQSAQQGYLPAQKLLAQDFASGEHGPIDNTQAIYWLASIALNDPDDHGYLFAHFLAHKQNNLDSSHLIEAWYQLAALNNPQAEQEYAHYLEQRFNQLRERQVSEIKALDEATQSAKAPQSTSLVSLSTDQLGLWLAAGAAALLIGGSGLVFYKYTHHIKLTKETNQAAELAIRVKELTYANKKLKRQLETIFKEFKQTKKQSDNHSLAIACAMFGYTPQTIPNTQAIKLRYRQLSKLYHPDAKGSDAEMTRLNQALKTILQNVTQK
ncbi:J domain-containing protein [Vibrio mytili]